MNITSDVEVFVKCSRCGFAVRINSMETTRDGVMLEIDPCNSFNCLADHKMIDVFMRAIKENKHNICGVLRDLVR